MKKNSKLIGIAMVIIMMLSLFASCASTSDAPAAESTTPENAPAEENAQEEAEELEPVTVRIGYHANEGGATIIAVAQEMGYFEEEGIIAELTKVESGPVEMAAMRASGRTLDMGYIGAGVAWNAMDPSGNGLKFVFFDGLSDAEALIARKGQFEDADGSGDFDLDEIYAGLMGKTVYLDTSTTPGGWLKSLVAKINEDRPQEEQLWIYSETSDYLSGYTAPNDDPAYMINCIQLANSNIASAMSTQSDQKVDIAVAFAPVPTTAIESNDDIEHIAATSTHLPDNAQPSTWVASEEWMAEDPEVVQRVVNALYKAAVTRAEDPDAACRLAEVLCQTEEGTFTPSSAIWPGAEDYAQWFADENSDGYTYMKALYESKKVGVPEGETPKAFEDCYDFSYMLNAFE